MDVPIRKDGAHRLRVDISRVDQLQSDDDDVIGDCLGMRAAGVQGVDVRTGRASALREIDQHLVRYKGNMMWPERGLASGGVYEKGRADALRDPQRLQESRLLRFVLWTRLGGMDLHASDRISSVGRGKPAVADGCGDARELGPGLIVSGADEDHVARRLDRRSEVGVGVVAEKLRIQSGGMVENDVEQDHRGVETGEVVDHLRVIRVEPWVSAQPVVGFLIDRDQRYARIRRRSGKELILRGIE